MFNKNNEDMKPRNGEILVVGIVARISGCQNQKELSLDDQVDHGKEVAREVFDGEIDFRIIATRGKGERLDRPELVELEERIRKCEFDLLIFEDVGRLVRGSVAHKICGIAVDKGTRVISPNDYLDTNEGSWEEDVLEACKEHIKHNAHTSKRIKHKKMNRFIKFGGASPCPPFGYIKPPNTKTYSDWYKNPETVDVILEGWKILKATLNGEAVAERWNEQEIETGQYCTNKEWDGKMVLRLYRNTIFKGKPSRGHFHTIKINEIGKRMSVKNPNGPISRDEPHLAFFDEDEYDSVIAAIKEKNNNYRRKKTVNGKDCRHRVPRKRTRSFGQHARCFYCGSHYVWGGSGIKHNLMCSNSKKWRCWNSVGFNGPRTEKLLTIALLEQLKNLSNIDEQFQSIVHAAKHESNGNTADREKNLLAKISGLDRKKKKLKSLIESESDNSDILKEIMEEMQQEELEIKRERFEIESMKANELVLPETTHSLESILKEEISKLELDSYEFGSLIRQLVPEMHIFLLRLCDGGHPLPCAIVTLNLIGSIKDAALVPDLSALMKRQIVIPLFEPPQREQIRVEAVRLAEQGVFQSKIAIRLNKEGRYSGKVTQAAVSNAILLHKKMLELGLENPYILLESPPEDYRKLRKHRNKKYRFKPIDGYEPPELDL